MKYVKCFSCEWQLENNPKRNWEEHPCQHCKNTRQVQDPDTILCNLCGGRMCHEITVPSGKWKSDYPCGLYNTKVSGGYESYHLFDMTNYTFSFCEECLRKLFLQCKIPPKVSDYHIGNIADGSLGYIEGDEQKWEDDRQDYEYRIWKDSGAYHQAYIDKKCNQKKDCPNKAIYTVLLSESNFSEEACCEEHKVKWENTVNARFVPFISNILRPFL